jgi:hypothetical protein
LEQLSLNPERQYKTLALARVPFQGGITFGPDKGEPNAN